MRHRIGWLCLVGLATDLIGLHVVGAAEPLADMGSCEAWHTLVIPKTDGPANVTAALDAGAWSFAARVTGFVRTDQPVFAEQQTPVSLFYDQAALWIGYRCLAPQDSPPVVAVTRRDGPVWRDDSVELFCDTTHSHDTYHHIVLNAAGAVYDAFGSDSTWNAQANTATRADADGWTAVLRIPFSAFGVACPEPGTVWSVNFCRHRHTPTERSRWAPGVTASFADPARFGHLVFGGPDARVVRFRTLRAPQIGSNAFEVDPLVGLRCRIEGLDARRNGACAMHENADAQGWVRFFAADDRVRQFRFSLTDAENVVLAQWTSPMESPEVAPRTRSVHRQTQLLDEMIDRFPPPAREKAEHALVELRPAVRDAMGILAAPDHYTPENWARLDKSAAAMVRLADPAARYAETLVHHPHAGFAVGLESSMRKVMIRDFVFEGYCADRYALALARNEHEALQIVVIPFHAGVKNARVSVGAFHRTDGRPSAEPPRAEVSLVGHVYTAENTPYTVTYRGWWPDPLLTFQKKCDVEVGEQVAFWIDVHTVATTGPGDYQADITVEADACKPIVIRLEARVWDIKLPECTHLRTAFTYDRPGVVKIYRDRWNAELERKYHDFVLERRLNIDHLYRRDPPDIALLEHAATKCLNAFNIMFLGNGGPGRVTEALATLETFMPAIRKSEVDTFAYIYGFDEVTQNTFPAIRETFDALHARYPTLKTMTTAIDPSFGRASGLREAVDIWVPLTSWYDRDEAEALRAEGKAMWWYVCITPPHPYANWFIEYPAIEARLLLGVMSYKYQTDGFLYYLITLWGKNREPIRSGPYTDWDPATFTNRRGETANGDGSLLCPGPDGPLSTIRLENIRDGIEDYEYLYLLAEVAERVRAAQRTPQRKAFLDHAATLLAVPEAVVRTLVDYTRDPQSLYAFREAVAQAILDGRRLSED